MHINTALVKSKNFKNAIKPSLLKHSQEYRVLATLRYLYPTKFDTMITGEAPDIQDVSSSTGIEVTVAVKEDDMKVSRVFSELNQGKPKDIEKRKKIVKASGYSFVPLKDESVAISTSGTADGEKHFFQESIRRKIEKLEEYRARFKRMGLAILLPETPTCYAENHLSEWISELLDESANLFDFVYVISHRFCLYYDAHAKITEKSSITQDESWLLATIGRMTAEGELSITDIEWQ